MCTDEELEGLAQVVGMGVRVPTVAGDRPYINFDNGASTPALETVWQTVTEFMPWYSSVHRGTGFKSRLSTEAYEAARGIVGSFVGANPAEHVVIFGKNTTEALNKLAHRLPLTKRDVVLISDLEHHSNDLPWRARATVRRIAATPQGGIDTQHFEKLLKKHAGRVKLVSITGASNVSGYLADIHWFARKAHEAGAQIAVDCAQLAAHRPIDMKSLHDPEHLDYVAISAHKMYAPFGAGALVGRKDTFADGAPDYAGGGTVSLVGKTWVDWASAPERDEAGSPNVVGVVALAKACQELQRIGLKNIARHESALAAYAVQKMADVPGLKLYGGVEVTGMAGHSGVIPFAITGLPHGLVAAILGYEWGIGVRSGCFCAHPYVVGLMGMSQSELAGVRQAVAAGDRSRLPGLVRVSFGLYNTRQEVDTLCQALQAIAAGRHVAYVQDAVTGDYLPKDPAVRARSNSVLWRDAASKE